MHVWNKIPKPDDDNYSYGFEKLHPIYKNDHEHKIPESVLDLQENEIISSIVVNRWLDERNLNAYNPYRPPYCINIEINFTNKKYKEKFLKMLSDKGIDIKGLRESNINPEEIVLVYENKKKEELPSIKQQILDCLKVLDNMADIHPIQLDGICIRANLEVYLGKEKIKKESEVSIAASSELFVTSAKDRPAIPREIGRHLGSFITDPNSISRVNRRTAEAAKEAKGEKKQPIKKGHS